MKTRIFRVVTYNNELPLPFSSDPENFPLDLYPAACASPDSEFFPTHHEQKAIPFSSPKEGQPYQTEQGLRMSNL